jgi:hypothetical protein
VQDHVEVGHVPERENGRVVHVLRVLAVDRGRNVAVGTVHGDSALARVEKTYAISSPPKTVAELRRREIGTSASLNQDRAAVDDHCSARRGR